MQAINNHEPISSNNTIINSITLMQAALNCMESHVCLF